MLERDKDRFKEEKKIDKRALKRVKRAVIKYQQEKGVGDIVRNVRD